MRLLFLLSQDIESSAGAGRYFPMAKELAQRGHQVVLLGLHPDFRSLSRRIVYKEGVKIWYVAPMHISKTSTRKIYYPLYLQITVVARATLGLISAALKSPADLIYVCKPHPMNGLAGFIASRIKRIPLIVDCDDYEARNNRFRTCLEQWVVEKFERWLLTKANYITVHSIVLKTRLIGDGIDPTRMVYLPHGIDYSRFKIGNPREVEHLRDILDLEGKRVIAYIGSFSLVSHALDVLLKAFEKVRTEMPSAVLLLVGRGEDYDWLEQQIKSMNIEPFVRLCGWVSPDKVALYYRLAQVSVDPVYDNEAARYSLSLKIFDSWACGVPLITTDVGDRRRILGEPPAGLIIPPCDPEALATAILVLLRNQEYASLLAERGQQRAKTFCWSHLVKSIEEIACEVGRCQDE
ncbi:MAG: glycosyltransferase family 4 protein [Candidatus Hadarchaeum sp.]|uniref:glycosyltransferase family 4 protein n=1 Tax=Candidatus Hadarchaeum sp. TaxID=2883567 RepID=UPI00316BFCD7